MLCLVTNVQLLNVFYNEMSDLYTFLNHFRQVSIDVLGYEGHAHHYYQFSKYKTIT